MTNKCLSLLKITTVFVLLISFFSSAYSTALAATYYVDATNGANSNTGTSQGLAWRSISKVNSSTFNPGDKILFKRGESWNERLSIPSSGSSGNPIIFNAYGEGNKPIINGLNLESCVYINSKHYITIANLELKKAFHNLYIRNGSTNIIIDNCNIHDAIYRGIYVFPAGNENANGIISNCNISYNGAYGIYFQDYAKNWTVDNNVVFRNGHSTEYGTFGGGIKVFLDGDGFVIKNNEVYLNGIRNDGTIVDKKGFGIWLDECTNVEKNIIKHNLCYDNNRDGIRIERTSNSDVYYNMCSNNLGNGIRIVESSSNTRVSVNNFAYNNTLYGNKNYGISIGGRSGRSDMHIYNNTFLNNISVENNKGQLIAVDGAGNDGVHSKNNIFENNCFGVEHNKFIFWGAKNYHTYADWENAYGSNTHSVTSDPRLSNPSNNNFKLLEGSPCIDAGAPTSINFDLIGNAVPQGSAVDIGAYEYIQTATTTISPPQNLRIIIQ